MQAKLPLVLALLASAGTFAADGVVTLYGVANVPLSYYDNGTVKQFGVNSPNTPSRIGFKGEEDLGEGMKAFFQIEQAVRLDDASTGAFASREGWVGLSGGFGKIGLGRGKTPYHNFSDTWDSIVDGDRNLTVFNDALLGLVAASRPNNQVRYDSPVISGFSAAASYAAGENKTASLDASHTLTLLGKYAAGPLMLGAAWEQTDKVANATTGLPQAGAKNTAWLLGGTYQIDALKLGLAYQDAKLERAGVNTTRNAVVTTAVYTLGATTLKAGAIFNQKVEVGGKTAADSDYTRYTLGAKYALSKRTAVYTEYSADDYKKDLAAKPKADISSLSFGIIHLF